jgi:transglutaminase-like putative cysteine protease
MMVIFSFGFLVSLSSWYLATYIFFSLLLVARMTLLARNARWQRSRLHLPLMLNLDVSRVALLVVFVFVIVAWNIPAIAATAPAAVRAWREVTDPLSGLRERLEKAFAPLQTSVQVVHGYYDNHLSLGRGQSRSREAVMVIEAPEPPSLAVRYYWRARTYNYFDGGTWYSTLPISMEELPEEFDATKPQYPGRWETTFKVTANKEITTLYVPNQPAWVSRPYQSVWFEETDGVFDFVVLNAKTQLEEGETYTARSYLSNFTSTDLRAAGSDYPPIIRENYLQLPDSITPRSIELAEGITAGLETPYDKAVAVTEFLREYIDYTPTVPKPPRDQDLVDWLLFDLGEGFCNYYATAEVVLLRAVGVPARWAVGYAQGQHAPGEDTDLATYSILYENSHSWPEVYFPGYGWVEFEPTASQDPIIRPVGGDLGNESGMLPLSAAEEDRDDQNGLTEEQELLEAQLDRLRTSSEEVSSSSDGVPIPWEFLLTFGGIALLLWGWRSFRARGGPALPALIEIGMIRLDVTPPTFLRSWSRLASLSPVERAYQEINRMLSGLNASPKITDTPVERVSTLVELVPQIEKPAQILLREYQNSFFGPVPGDISVVQSTLWSIRKYAYKAIILAWLENTKNKLIPKRFR